MSALMELDTLLKPSWGSEKWILEGWNTLNTQEQQSINIRVLELFKDGLPFELEQDQILYLHLFALLAQLKILALQLPLRFEKELIKPEFQHQMHQQLIDEIFQTIVLTKILFLLSTNSGKTPSYNKELEQIAQFTGAQECPKLAIIFNLLSKNLLHKIFANFYEHQIAPKLFELLLKDETRHLNEADSYLELGLPEELLLKKALQNFEELIISAFTLEPRYSVALSNLLGPKATDQFIASIHQNYVQQLKKINQTPSHQIDLAIEMGPSMAREADEERRPIEMSTTKRATMSQLNNPGDPRMIAQFNLDISEYCALEMNFSHELLTLLMMQTLSLILEENESFRNFLSFKKLYQTKGAYVALVEKLKHGDNHLGTICFKDCHQFTIEELLFKLKKAELLMQHCDEKREQIEKEHPKFQQNLTELLESYTDDHFPNPFAGSYGVYISNAGIYGYTQAAAPLLKHTGLHVLLLAIEKKPVWNATTKSFDAKDILPISISADSRIFDGLFPLPELVDHAFKAIFKKMQTKTKKSILNKTPQISELLAKKGINHLLDTNVLAKEAKKILGGELETYRQKLSSSPNLRNLADELLLDYLGLNPNENNGNFKKHVEKLLADNLELGYRVLMSLQSLWCDYLDIEKNFSTAYKNVANKRLAMLAKLLPSLIKQSKKL